VAAVESGAIERSRLDAYLQFVAEQAVASDRTTLKNRRSAQKQSSSSAKTAMEAISDRDV
jgi:hypothetical protein